MQRSTGYPKGAARRHDPQPALQLATERTTLHEHDLALPVVVEVQLDPAEIAHRKSKGHDWAGQLVGIDPVGLRGRGVLPSLHLNVGDAYRRLGDLPAARRHADFGLSWTKELRADGYGDLIKSGLQRLKQRCSEQE